MKRTFVAATTLALAWLVTLVPAVAQNAYIANVASRRPKPTHWYRPQALAAFHGLVQGIAVGNIDEHAAAVECRQGD